jgi:hypothetical protein
MRRQSCCGVPHLRVVAALIALILLSGCTSSLEGPPDESIAATGQSNVDAKPASAEEVVRAAIKKSSSADTVKYHQEISASSDIPATSMDVQILRSEQVAYLIGTFSDTQTEQIFGPDGVLVRIPPNDKWVRSPRSGGPLNELMTAMNAEPFTFLISDPAAVAAVDLVGPEEVQGSAANHYRVDLDADKWIQAAADMAPVVREEPDYEATLGQNVPADLNVWINDDGFISRSTGTSAGASYSVEFLAYDQPVSIPSPPESEIITPG